MQNHPSAPLLHLFAALFAVIAALSSYSPQSASAQPSRTFGAEKMLSRFALDVWQAENGMPSSTVLSICQAHDGYIWMGTFGGLVRFDGVKFRVFKLIAKNVLVFGCRFISKCDITEYHYFINFTRRLV